MQTTSYVALSSQAALSRQLDIVANNIANASTPAFKAQNALFQQYLTPASAGTPSAFVHDVGTYRDAREGPLDRTGNPLDLAIDGPGYIAVSTDAGERYTRNGRLQLGPNGTLVTANGHPVLDTNGNPLTLPAGATDIVVTTDGTVSTKNGPAGKIRLVAFDDEQQVESGADGLYVTSQDPQPATKAVLHQGMVENSNVQTVVELTRMMSLERSYTAANDLVSGENDRVKNAIDKLSKIV